MKSFKQKQEEKARRLEAERLIAEEKAFQIAQQKESKRIEQERLDEIAYNKALLEEQQLQEDKIWEERQAKKLQEQQELEYQNASHRDKQIKEYRASKEKELEFRSSQKDIIKDILSGEDKIRETISSAERQVEMEDYERHQLEKIEESEKILEQELAALKAEQEQEKLDEKAEQEKLARWKENEKIEQEEKQRMRELREAQEEERKAKEAAELQEIISSREIYELRQKEIAKQQEESRIAVNEILQEVQFVLDSEKNSSEKEVLSNLQNYIYRLNPNQEKDIWTERKQPKSILTWEEWKQVPANNILVEQDFKRARLLFEQDNQRAQRYHDYVYQTFAGRNLTLDRKKAIAASGKLVDIPHNKLVETRREIMEEIGDVSFWLDASDAGSIDSVVTASLGTASISAFWVPDANIGINDSKIFDTETFESGGLHVSGANALFDGDPDTYCKIYHNSASYDWRQRNINQYTADPSMNFPFWGGIICIRIKLPEEHYDKRVERYEIYSTDRKYIPTFVTSYLHTHADDTDIATPYYERHINNDITSSHHGNYNAQIVAGGEGTASRSGGRHGITPEGSSSLDPYIPTRLYPAAFRNVTDNSDPKSLFEDINYWGNDIIIRINDAAHASEIRLQGVKVWYQEESGSIQNGQGVHQIRSQKTDSIHPSASIWTRNWHQVTPYSRHTPIRPAQWFSSSVNQPDGIDMPYIAFTSQSYGAMRPNGEFFDYADSKGFTQFWVVRDMTGQVSQNSIWFYDAGQTYKTAVKIGVAGYYKGIYANLTDWDPGGDLTSTNQRHTAQIYRNVFAGETDLYGDAYESFTSSGWPYRGTDHYNTYDGLTLHKTAILQTETSIVTHQLDNPMTEVSSSRLRTWHKGGTPFVDLDAGPTTDYTTTGSAFAAPELGGSRGSEWGAFRLHEVIMFGKVLTTDEIDTVHDYLSDKWQLNTYPAKSDANGEFVYGYSSSDSSQDIWLYDATDRTDEDTIHSSSAWELD